MSLEPPERREAPDARTSNGGPSVKQPKYKPTLRNYQPVQPKPGRRTVARALRRFGKSEARVEVVTKNDYPHIRISTVEWPGLSHKLDLRPSDVRCVINGLHLALGEL